MESSKGNTMFLLNKLDVNYKNEVCEVYELAQKHGLNVEFLEMREGPICNATFSYQVTVGDFSGEGRGDTKVSAKKLAAQQVLVGLRSLSLPASNSVNRNRRKKKRNVPGTWQAAPVFMPGSNPITCLQNVVSQMRGKPEQYTVVDIDKESETWLFYVQLTVADETLVGTGHSRKEAKRNAAAQMLSVLGYNFPHANQQQSTHTPDDALTPVTQEVTRVQKEESQLPSGEQQTPQAAQEAALDAPAVTQDVTAHYTQQSSAEVQLTSVDLQLLPEEVLPLLASMKVIGVNNDVAEWCDTRPKKQLVPNDITQDDTAPGTWEKAPEGIQEASPEVSQGDTSSVTRGATSQPEEEAQSKSVDLQLDSPEQVEEMLQEDGEENVSPGTQEPEISQGDAPKVIQSDKEPEQEIALEKESSEVNQDTPDVTQGETSPATQEDEPTETHGDTSEATQEDSLEVTRAETSTSTQVIAPEVTEDITSQVAENNETQIEEEEIQPTSVDLRTLPQDVLPLLFSMGVIKDKNGSVEWLEPNPTPSYSETFNETIKQPVSLKTTIVGTESPSETSTGLNISLTTNGPEESSPSEDMTGPECSKTTTVPEDSDQGKSSVILPVKPDTIPGSEKSILPALSFGRPVVEAVVSHFNSVLRAFQNRPKSALSRLFSALRRAFTT